MARRFLFSTTSGSGHVHPLVPLARALQQAGHDVAFAVRPALQRMLDAAGFIVIPVGGDLEVDPEYRQVQAQLETMPLNLATEMFSYPRLFGGNPGAGADAGNGADPYRPGNRTWSSAKPPNIAPRSPPNTWGCPTRRSPSPPPYYSRRRRFYEVC